MTPQHTTNFDEILEIAHKGARRAAVFLGLGLNAAHDQSFRDYRLTKHTQIEIMPDNVGDDTIRHFKEEFALWVTAGGLRELTESFAAFLDRIHATSVLFGTAKRIIQPDLAQVWNKKFHRKGFDDKLDLLNERFAITTPFRDELISINKARNCLVHRRGIVGPEDCDAGGTFRLRWIGADVFAETPSGEIFTIIPSDKKEAILLPEGAEVKLNPQVRREMVLRLREQLRPSPTMLAELCTFVSQCATQVLLSTINYAKSLGFTLIEAPKTDAEHPEI